jgi:hypothetical protein
MVALIKEDGFYESVGALCFFTASVLFFILYFRSLSGNNLLVFSTRKNIFYFLLGILFLFVAGEEISWGQRIFNLQTPAFFQDKNIQGELNLHNLDIFNSVDANEIKRPWWDIFSMSRLFKIFWFTYCFMCPLLNRISPFFAQWFTRFNLPLVPLWLGVLFPLNYVLSKVMDVAVGGYHYDEIEEFNHAILFAVAGYTMMSEQHGKKQTLT